MKKHHVSFFSHLALPRKCSPGGLLEPIIPLILPEHPEITNAFEGPVVICNVAEAGTQHTDFQSAR